MENKNEETSFVLIGYQENITDFIGRLKFSEIFKRYRFEEKDQFKITAENVPPKEIIERIRGEFPIRIFENYDKTINVTYVLPENKIIIKDVNFNAKKFDEFKQLCLNIVDTSKFINVIALGINFSITYDLDYKLRLFNNQINQLTGWDNNIGFSISIPISFEPNIIANYKIEKLSENEINNKKIRKYKTFVNYNFDLRGNSEIDLAEILSKGETVLYNSFNKNQEEIIKIGQINND